MVFNTLSVAAAVSPSVVETYVSHFLHRAPLRQKPTAHISYHEGLRLIRQFLDYSSKHTVDELQAFTAQWVPAPHWVRILDLEVAPQFLDRAARILQAHLGRRDIDKVGGATWWQWRRVETPLRAEWIEMKKEHNERRRTGSKCERCILYIHGGAYYFGSVDEHRYQMQRHARKLKARVLAPRYRLAPQYPFPCALYDCLATYLYLLEHFPANQLLFAGDSAGGGLVLSLLVILRDQGLPLPAGTILLSPWVDLTHSFPSVAGDGAGDYIPPHGFHHRPSMAWPPPPNEDIKRKPKVFAPVPEHVVELPATAQLDTSKTKKRKTAGAQGAEQEEDDGHEAQASARAAKRIQPMNAALPGIGENLTITLDGVSVKIKEQIQLYAPNELLSHPLVSPVQQPSLGGLPPMLIQVGGAELLRDEQIYLAHKAANPEGYPPSDAVLNEYDIRREALHRYPPTNVQLQVWDDLCHVPHTLSFTRPAKFMYRSVAQFGAWALANAQDKDVDVDDDEALSIISDGPDTADEDDTMSIAASTSGRLRTRKMKEKVDMSRPLGSVGVAGDPLPPFKDHMIRQRVTRHGAIFPLALPSQMACLHLDPATIGTIKPAPVRKWLAQRRENELRFANETRKIQKKKAKELLAGLDSIEGEDPPPTALVRRRKRDTGVAPEEKKKGKSWGLAMWSGWGSSHDESTLDREEKLGKDFGRSRGPSVAMSRSEGITAADSVPNGATSTPNLLLPPGELDGGTKKKRRLSSASMFGAQRAQPEQARPRSPQRPAVNASQAGDNVAPGSNESTPTTKLYGRRSSISNSMRSSRPVSVATSTSTHPSTFSAISPSGDRTPGSASTYLGSGGDRLQNATSAFPFRLRQPASISALQSDGLGMMTPVALSHAGEEKEVAPSLGTNGLNHHMSPLQMSRQPQRLATSTLAQDLSPVELPVPEQTVRHEMDARPKAAKVLPRSGSSAQAAGTNVAGSSRSMPLINTAVGSPAPRASSRPVHDSPLAPDEMCGPKATRTPVFDHRTSILGQIGPDGMPTAPLAPRNLTEDSPTELAMPKLITSIANNDELTPISPLDGSDKVGGVPFKLRNPVFDPRADSESATLSSPPPHIPIPAPAPPIETPRASEEARAMPFKLRHVIRDQMVTPTGSRSQTPEQVVPVTLPARANSVPRPEIAAAPARTATPDMRQPAAALSLFPSSPPLSPYTNGLPPNSNVIMPTRVARRPNTARQDTLPIAAANEVPKTKTDPWPKSLAKPSLPVDPAQSNGDVSPPPKSTSKPPVVDTAISPKYTPKTQEGKRGGNEAAVAKANGMALPRSKFSTPPPVLEEMKFDAIDLAPLEESEAPLVKGIHQNGDGRTV